MLKFSSLISVACSLTLAACSGTGGPRRDMHVPLDSTPAGASGLTSADVIMQSASGRSLGTATLMASGEALSISGTVRGLPPGVHGIHLHTTGACTAPTFESAGAHWNPAGKEHGTKNPRGAHRGDLPNIVVGADSTARLVLSVPGGVLHGATGLLDSDGAALVIHADRDDELTDPAGNAGDRLACGVVNGG